MVLLDTNILIKLQKNNPPIVRELHHLKFSNLAINTVTVGEMLFGALNKADLLLIQRRRGLPVLPLAPRIGELATDLLATYSLSHRLHFPDALVAATALHHGIALYTLNLRYFRFVSNLVLHQPAQP